VWKRRGEGWCRLDRGEMDLAHIVTARDEMK
jgi:hypothetical protein